jgi:GGDEF domain-containing protein
LETTHVETVLVYFDFDNFKPFNDKYGFRLGDRAILLFAELLSKDVPRDNGFAGHIGGDDFFAGFRRMGYDEVKAICADLTATFQRDVESFYDDETRRRGHMTGMDRMGNQVVFPLMTVSAALVHLPPGRPVHSADEVAQLIALLKKEAKHSPDHISGTTIVPQNRISVA